MDGIKTKNEDGDYHNGEGEDIEEDIEIDMEDESDIGDGTNRVHKCVGWGDDSEPEEPIHHPQEPLLSALQDYTPVSPPVPYSCNTQSPHLAILFESKS